MNPAQDSNTTESKLITQKLSLSDAAELIGISHTSLRRYETLGKINAERLENGYRLFDIEEAKNFKKQLEIEREEYRRKLATESLKNRGQASQIKPTFEKLGLKQPKKSFSWAKVASGALIGAALFTAGAFAIQSNTAITNNVKKYALATHNFVKSTISPDKAAATYTEIASGDVLAATDRKANWEFSINVPANFKENVIAEKDLTVLGSLTANQLATLTGGLTTTSLTFSGANSIINNLGAIDTVTKTTLQTALNIGGATTDLNGNTVGDTTTTEGNILMAVGGEWVSTPQTDITSLGVIGTGTWEADPIGASFGGTGITSYNTGDILYATAPGTLAAVTIGPNGYLLTSNGTSPSWQSLSSSVDTVAWMLDGNAGTNAVTQYLGTNDAQGLTFRTNGAERIFISSTGLTGIGTTTPSQQLDVAGAIRLGTAGTNNILNTSVAGGAPSGNLFWGNYAVLDSNNVTMYATTGIAAGNGLVGGGTTGLLSLGVGAGNGITVNADDITIDATTAGTTSVTAANSGLEVTADGLRLLGGCANGQSLMWDSTMQAWKCSVVFPTGTGNANQVTFWSDSQTLTSSNNFFWDNGLARLGVGTTAALQALDIHGAIRLGALSGGNVLNTTVGTSSPTGDLFWGTRTLTDNINIGSYATTGVTAGSGLTGGGTVGSLTVNIGAGNGITINADDITIDATTTSTTSTTASNSGLEVTASGLKLIGGCADNEVLAWDTTLSVWKCSTKGAASITGTGSAGQVSFWTGSSALSGSDNFYWNNGSGVLGLGTTNPASTLTIKPTTAAGLQLNPFGTSAGQTTEFRLLELAANGTNYTGFKSPDNLDNSIVYTLPSSTGPADYVLTIQNDQSLQWKQLSGIGGVGDVSAVGSMASGAAFSDATADDQWLGLGVSAGRIEFDDQATDEINLLSANVGIGTTAPTQLLDVNGAIRLGTIGLNNILNTNAAGGTPSGNLFWGSRTIVDSTNISSLNISTLTSANAGLTLSGATGPVTITLDVTTTGLSSTTASNSGLEIGTDGVRLLGGCADNELLKWDSSMQVWKCGTAGAGTVTGTGSVGQAAFWTGVSSLSGTNNFYWSNTSSYLGIGTTAPLQTLDVRGAVRLGANANGGNVLNTTVGSSAPSGDLFWGTRTLADSVNISSYATTGVTAGSGLTGGGTVGSLSIDIGAGNGITVNANDITIDSITSGTSSTTASNSGLEVASDGLRLLGGCGSNEILSWDAGASRWRCISVSGLGSITGNGVATRIAFWNSSSSIASSQSLYWDNTNTRLGIGTSAPTYSVDVAGVARAYDVATQELILGASNANILSSYVGYDGYTNFTGGIGTGGKDSLVASQRITTQGNLVNIGSIQAGTTTLTAAGAFGTAATYPALGAGTSAITIGDFNADGVGDIAYTNNTTNSIGVRLNSGNGTFATAATYPSTASGPQGVANGDLNGDGKADIVYTNSTTRSIGVLINSGSGTFGAATTYPSMGLAPNAVVVGDINGDGKSDIAIAEQGSNSIGIMINSGSGTFANAYTYPAMGLSPANIAIADVNGDGKSDLAYTNNGGTSNSIGVMINSGSGTFGTATTYPSKGFFAYGIAVGDFSGDGKADIAFSNASDAVGTLINSGTGTFGAATTYPTLSSGDSIWQVALADFNGDGKPDMVTTDSTTDNLLVYINNGAGTFATPTLYATNGTTGDFIAAGDLNGDGKADVAIPSFLSNSVSILLNTPSTILNANAANGNLGIGITAAGSKLSIAGGVMIGSAGYIFGRTAPSNGLQIEGRVGIGTSSPTYQLDVTGAARFTDVITQELILGASNASILSSFGGYDGYTNHLGGIGTGGKDSLIAAQRLTSQGNLVNIGSIQAGAVTLTSAGTFGTATTYPSLGAGTYSITIGDFNADGIGDVAYANFSTNSIGVRLNNGNGTLAAATTYPATTSGPQAVANGDLNGDGKADVVYANATTRSIGVLINSGSGTFATATTYPSMGLTPAGVVVGDINGDGKADIAIAEQGSHSVGIMINNGGGTFASAYTYPAMGLSPSNIAIADVNGDGKSDLVYTNQSTSSIAVMTNNGNGLFSTATTYPSKGTSVFGLAVGDFSGDGKADIAYSNLSSDSVGTLINSGTGTFGSATTYPTLSTGGTIQQVALADFNGDGKADLATTDSTSNNMLVYINNGAGTFSTPTLYSVSGTNTVYISAGDLNNDGKADVAVANFATNSISILLNTPTTMFNASAANGNLGVGITASSSKLSIAGGAVIGSAGYIFGRTAPSNGLQIEGRVGIGTSSPTYQLDVTGAARFTDVITQELILGASNANILNAFAGYDGFTDVTGGIGTGGKDSLLAMQRITTQGNLVNIGSIQAGGTTLTSGGTFGAASTYPSQGTGPTSVVAADINGDNINDLVVAYQTNNRVGVFTNPGTGIFGLSSTTYPGAGGANMNKTYAADLNGDGRVDIVNAAASGADVYMNVNSTLAAAVTYNVGGTQTTGIGIGDVTGDGKPDIVGVSGIENSFGVLRNTGNGTFSTATTYPALGTTPITLVLTDVNGDGKQDAVIANNGSVNSISVFTGNGNGTFGTGVTYPAAGSALQEVAAADLNGDGKPEIVTTNLSSNSISVFTNYGNGLFTAATTYPSLGSNTKGLALGDLTGDGKVDIVASNQGSGSIAVFTNNGFGSFGTATTYPTLGTTTQGVAIADINADGKNDIIVANSASNGVAVFLNTTSTIFNANAALSNVGIGVTASSSKLSVAGNAIIGSAGYIFGNTASTNGLLVQGVSGFGSTVNFIGIGNITSTNSSFTINATVSDFRVFSASNNWLAANADTIIDLDNDNNGSNALYVRNGADGQLLSVNETGSYTLDVTGAIRATTTIYANQSGGIFLAGGDDSTFRDVDVANTVGIYGAQDSTLGCIRLGSGATDLCGGSGNLGIGMAAGASTKLSVAANLASGYAASFTNAGDNVNRLGLAIVAGSYTGTGTSNLIDWYDGDGTYIGSVTFTGGTVSYGAFTANHDTEIPEEYNEHGYDYGTILCIDSAEAGPQDQERGIVYHSSACDTGPYADNVLGIYAGKYSNKPNLHQVYVLGDGQVLVNGEGGDIKIGDQIVTSSTKGIGMKATKYGTSIAYAQQNYHFGSPSEVKLIAVQYGLGKYVDSSELSLAVSQATNNQEEIDNLRADVGTIKELLGLVTSESSESSESSSSNSLLSNIQTLISAATDQVSGLMESLGLSNDNGTLTVSSDMNVLGDTTLSNVTVTGDFLAGQFKIDSVDNSLDINGPSCYNNDTQIKNNLLCEAQTMYIQKGLAGNVNLFDGNVVIEPDGNITVKGAIKATKVSADEFEVTGEDHKLIGSSVLGAGTTRVVIGTTGVKANSKIFVTPTSFTGEKPLIVTQKTEGQNFEVAIESPYTTDISFDWWIVNVANSN